MTTAGKTVHAGKKFEKEVAELLGGRRLTRTNYGLEQHDVELVMPDGGRLLIECKLRAALAVEGFFAQAEKYASVGRGDIPIVVMKCKGKRLSDAIIAIRMAHAEDLVVVLGALGAEELHQMAENIRGKGE